MWHPLPCNRSQYLKFPFPTPSVKEETLTLHPPPILHFPACIMQSHASQNKQQSSQHWKHHLVGSFQLIHLGLVVSLKLNHGLLDKTRTRSRFSGLSMQKDECRLSVQVRAAFSRKKRTKKEMEFLWRRWVKSEDSATYDRKKRWAVREEHPSMSFVWDWQYLLGEYW